MGPTVLAVDDSRTIRHMINHTLPQAGMKTHLAEDGEQGLEMLDTIAPDVIITDINMPKLDGFGFIDALRAQDRHASVPILVLTTEGSDDLKARARQAGTTGWIVKPFDPDKLIRSMQIVAG